MLPEIPAHELYRQLTSAEAADFLNISLMTLERHRREGSGPQYLRIKPNVVRYRLVDLITWQESYLIPQEVAHG